MSRFLKIFLFILFVFGGGYVQASGQWHVVSEKSRLGFMCKSTLHDFNGSARKLSGILEKKLNLAKGFVDVDVASFTTDEPGRDKNMYQMFNASLYPQIHFVFNDTDITKIIENQEGEIKFTGIMTMHNISHPVTLISKGHMEGNTLMCEGQMLIHLKDYGLKPPSILGLIHVSDEVAVQYNIGFMNS